MPAPGYYKTNYRALRFSEIIRMNGWLRAPWLYLVSRRMRPSGVAWFPGLWSEMECPRENLSNEFWRATESHRKAFTQLGFTEIGFQNHPRNLNPNVRDTGGIRYWNADHTCSGQLLYHHFYNRKKRAETTHMVIGFTAVFDDGTSFGCTNNRKAFDPLAGNEVIRLDSDDPTVIYERFQKKLRLSGKRPRAFTDIDSLRQWYDDWQLRLFELRVNRRLFLPMTEQEIAAARAKFENKAPPPIPMVSIPRRTLIVWFIIIGAIILLEAIKHFLRSSP